MNLGLRFFGFFIFLITLLLLFVLIIQIIRYSFKRIGFPKKLALTTVASCTVLLAIFIYVNYFFTFDSIDRASMQEGEFSSLSPSEQFEAKFFYEPYGGAVGGVNVWVEVTDLKTAITKVIYYADAKQNILLQWFDDSTLFISNGNLNALLQVETDIYHENGLACQSLLMRDQYETCYQEE